MKKVIHIHLDQGFVTDVVVSREDMANLQVVVHSDNQLTAEVDSTVKMEGWREHFVANPVVRVDWQHCDDWEKDYTNHMGEQAKLKPLQDQIDVLKELLGQAVPYIRHLEIVGEQNAKSKTALLQAIKDKLP